MQNQNTEKNKNESKYFRTAAKMDEALLALLEKKDFEYITVKEICESAGVNRSTFYLHYENTQELLEEATRHVIDKFLTYFSEHDKISFEEKALSELVFVRREYIIPYLNYIKENRRVFVTVLNNLGVMGFEVYYKRMFRYIFNPILERFGVDASERWYVMKFYLTGITAIAYEWLKGGCREETEKICDIIEKCTVGSYGNEANK